MFRNLLIVTMTFIFFLFIGISQVSAQSIDYDLYQRFLDSFVKKEKNISGFILNVVDYKSINNDKNNPDSLYQQILKMVRAVNLSTLKTKEEKVAFWINVYNIGAIKMIIDHYPVDSIRSRKISWLKNPWGKKIITVDGSGYSLGEIEHEILLKKLKEPMAHFAIVCASLSCPDISEKVYRPDILKEQLKSMAQGFLVNKKKGLKIDRNRGEVYFSQIFKFDSNTFPNGAKDALSLIVPIIEKDDGKYLTSGKYKIKYFDYDWSVNDLKRAL